MISKTIYQTWKTKKLPSIAEEAANKIRAANPSYKYELYDDVDVFYFLKENYDRDLLAAYESLNAGAAKADLWRYCMLYKRGGIYVDIDSIIFNIQDFVKPEDRAIISREGNRGAFLQWCLMFESGHPILAQVIDDCVFNIKNRVSNSVVYVTAPWAFTAAIKKTVNIEGDLWSMPDEKLNKEQDVCRFYGIDYGEYAKFMHCSQGEKLGWYSESHPYWQQTRVFKD